MQRETALHLSFIADVPTCLLSLWVIPLFNLVSCLEGFLEKFLMISNFTEYEMESICHSI